MSSELRLQILKVTFYRGLIISSFSSLYEEPGKSGTHDIDMDCETIEEQTAAAAEGTGLDDDEDENRLGSETLRDNTSMHWQTTDFPLTMEQQGVFWDSAGAEESLLSELIDLDRMLNCTTTHDDTEDRITNGFPDSCAFETLDTPAQETADRNANPSASQGQDMFASLVNQILVAQAPEKCTPAKTDFNQALEPEETPPNSDSTISELESGEDFEELSDVTEHPLEKLDEMFDMTEHPVGPYNITEHPFEPSNEEQVELKPFNFLGCPDNVRQRILRFTLHNDEQITPYWNFGALEVPARKCRKQNYPTVVAAFAGNRELADQTATILYGENVFRLERVRIALWWLRRIGPANVARLRHLVVTVQEGITDGFGTRAETLWLRAFLLLPREKQHLHSLWVDFQRWTFETNRSDGLGPRDRPVWEPRHILLRTLFGFRGLHRAVVVGGPFVSRLRAFVLQRAMVMAPGERDDDVRACVRSFPLPEMSGVKYSFA